MAVTSRQRTVVNSARRRYSPAQIKAGFGGKRRQAAAKAHRKRSKPKAKAKTNTSHKSRSHRSRPKTKTNLGKIISYSLPKEFQSVATTKKNKGRRKASHHRRKPMKANTHHRRRSRMNPGLGDITGLVTSAVFTIAGAVGSKYLTQMVLTTSNTGVMGYLGNLVAAFVLSWATKAFMKNEKAAAAVLAGGMVQVVLRLIVDYTPYGQYASLTGVGDYQAQNFMVPQRLADGMHNAQITTAPGWSNLGGAGMGACSLYGGSNLYQAA